MAEPAGDLATALAHTERLLGPRPDLAEAQAREILKVVRDHPGALTLLARAQAVQGRSRAAIDTLRRTTSLAPGHALAWRLLAEQLDLVGDSAAAEQAQARHIRASVNVPELMAAATALCDNDLPTAERLLKPYLADHPTDVAAIRLLAEVAARLGRFVDSQALLERCLELAPGFTAARANHATVLYRQNKSAEAAAQLDRLLAEEPDNPGHRTLRAAARVRIGDYLDAIADYEIVLASHPDQPKAWMSYGHALKTVGRVADGIAAYRRSLALAPGLGETWWSLANLKTYRFTDEDLATMRSQLARDDLTDEDRFHLDFALGKALEDAGQFEVSFAHYAAGNALRRQTLDYDRQAHTDLVARTIAFFTPERFAERAGAGCAAPDPIFVVGLPRAGSTLVEQILASHSMVEGTMELPDIIALARRIAGGRNGDAYPEALADLPLSAFRELGEEYLERTRIQRKLGRPLFIDKMPNNWSHTGFIHLILPNARIVDARRHPLGCGFSGFKQHFARGQSFTYDLTDIGGYYADYVRLMAHIDAVLPGRVHRVIYEAMVADPEGQVRALLDYCGLPFEAGCLKFYENDRAVRTASSEQVRQPIFAEGVDQWRSYEPWLGPLKAALGPVLDAYPDAPPNL
ncbi:tetratricopeptide (TPR) repeat protein [Caulobacter ginsengisoli]|uniref:Tetratricopeptide (TPR) repeat protein n=1 Tax=Caulobacter ginsengisoli TaxID=400775 RepID=A0ABU0IRB1_9CAUL|nr:sulfotransferase [Caulobacter ginsengisoli]MDQ0463693.1 tetratricopeptide (TPR) repeat protein [Caulobacter ginsengisoli]